MILFIITLIVALVSLFAIAFGVKIQGDGDGSGVLAGGIGGMVLAAILLIVNCSTIVPTRNVGVQVSFGKPVGSLSNGYHWVAPWSSVEKFDTSIQTIKLTQAKDDDGDCATVRLANQTTACVDTTVQWNIDPSSDVVELYRKYRNFEKIEVNLVERQLQRALNVVFEKYNPLSSVTGGDAPSVSLDDLAKQATDVLKAAVGAGITIDSITIPLVHYDSTTQDKLNAFAQALADTRIAEQRKKTAELVKQANDILAASAAVHDPGVLYQNCLNLIADLAAKGQLKDLPPTFNCNQMAGGTPVIVGK